MSDLPAIEPLQVQGLSDYHVHCDYSVDATGTIEEYCEAALKRGLAEICFTSDFDANPDGDRLVDFIRVKGKDLPVSIENLGSYVDHVHRAAEQFYPLGLSVKLGLEFGWYPGCEEKVVKLKEAYAFDYLLCGVHELDNICFACRKTAAALFAKYGPEQMVESYFDSLTEAAGSALFDSIAHAAYYLRYGPDYYGQDMRQLHLPWMDGFFEQLIATDTALEINTSGIRHGHSHYYPTVEILNLAKKRGVRVDKLGSDSHHPSQIGLDFEIASALIPSSIRNCESD
ncbi:MAG: histidinol-phosphatase [bacterium]|nr:histidinol-phosphatase [bacterium]